MSQEKEFWDLCDHVDGHRQREETLNRLFRKNVGEELPYLTKDNTEIIYETMKKRDVFAMVRPGKAHDSGGEVTILEFESERRMFDGHKRARTWADADPAETVKVRILKVLEGRKAAK